MPAGLQTFNADGTESYDGYSSIMRCSLARLIVIQPDMNSVEYIPGIHQKIQEKRALVFMALDGKLYPLRDVRSDNKVYFRASFDWSYLVVLEWGNG
ncbi:hypothetical protein ACFMKY_17860 [Pseudomonas protegens]|uniref:hypothetical protein n=1 Tax=Pseudomonas protegens TaxID=380021 RepID=UPI003672EE40